MSDELMIRVPYDHPPSAVDYLNRLNEYSFDLADEYRRLDVLVQSADDYIDSDLLRKVEDMAREPLKVAIQPFVDQNE